MKEQTQSGDENNKETSRYNKCGKEGEITNAGSLVRETLIERGVKLALQKECRKMSVQVSTMPEKGVNKIMEKGVHGMMSHDCH